MGMSFTIAAGPRQRSHSQDSSVEFVHSANYLLSQHVPQREQWAVDVELMSDVSENDP
jgi:hypothetical protein